MINAQIGSKSELDLGTLIIKRIQLIGSVLRSRTLLEKKEIASSIENTALVLINQNRFKVPLDEIYNIENAQQAFTRIEKRINKGKVLLCIGGEVVSF